MTRRLAYDVIGCPRRPTRGEPRARGAVQDRAPVRARVVRHVARLPKLSPMGLPTDAIAVAVLDREGVLELGIQFEREGRPLGRSLFAEGVELDVLEQAIRELRAIREMRSGPRR